MSMTPEQKQAKRHLLRLVGEAEGSASMIAADLPLSDRAHFWRELALSCEIAEQEAEDEAEHYEGTER